MNKQIKLLQIFRWKNLLLIVLLQGLIEYHLLTVFQIKSILTNLQFIALVTATLLVVSGGYIINDIFDLEIDRINKPSKVWIPHFLDLKQAKLLYYSLNILGLSLSFYVSYSIDNYRIFIYFSLLVFLLYIYSAWAKKQLIVNNVLVSLLITFSLLIVALIETTKEQNKIILFSFWDMIGVLSFFAFSVTLLREIVKDAEDRIGDIAIGVNSIPIKYGFNTTNFILKILTLILIGITFSLAISQFKTQLFLSLYILFGIVPSFVLFFKQLHKASKSLDYAKLSTLLKIIMLVGILSVFFIF